MKDLAGVKVKCDSLQGLANKHCTGNLGGILANITCDFFESVSNDFTPLSPDDTLLPPGADTAVPDVYIIKVSEVTNHYREQKQQSSRPRREA